MSHPMIDHPAQRAACVPDYWHLLETRLHAGCLTLVYAVPQPEAQAAYAALAIDLVTLKQVASVDHAASLEQARESIAAAAAALDLDRYHRR